ncbi:MAG: hypothetical protein ABSD99_11750, partial [Candidatus Bathyarchaeia archaeon]
WPSFHSSEVGIKILAEAGFNKSQLGKRQLWEASAGNVDEPRSRNEERARQISQFVPPGTNSVFHPGSPCVAFHVFTGKRIS